MDWLFCLVVFLAAYVLNVFYITVFYHRGLTHGAVALAPWARALVVRTGNWITGIDPKAWCCMHRLHHLHSDTDKDPHSPVRLGIFGVALGQLRSYQKTLTALIREREAYASIVKDLNFPVHWLNRTKLWYLPYLAHAGIALALSLLTGHWPLGLAYWLGMMSHPVQGWLVNSLGHALGYRNFDTPDNSRNNTWVAWLVFGEGYQNNHHHRPDAAKFSMRRWEVDLGYGLCLAARTLGVIRFPARTPEASSQDGLGGRGSGRSCC